MHDESTKYFLSGIKFQVIMMTECPVGKTYRPKLGLGLVPMTPDVSGEANRCGASSTTDVAG